MIVLPSDAFDKVAKFLELPLGSATSGGQLIEELASGSRASQISFPIPAPGELLFSYSGLKSAVKRTIGEQELSLEQKKAIAAAFQIAAVGQIEEKISLALKQLAGQPLSSLVASGGVASNGYLRERCVSISARSGRPLTYEQTEAMS